MAFDCLEFDELEGAVQENRSFDRDWFDGRVRKVNNWVKKNGDYDKSLEHRWNGIRAAWEFHFTEKICCIEESARKFQEALGELKLGNARAYQQSVAAKLPKSAGTAKVYQEPEWSTGAYVLYDWLVAQGTARNQAMCETTPILCAVTDTGGFCVGKVPWLVVELLDGAHGLIVPDLFAFGLTIFRPTADYKFNFLQAMHKAMEAVVPDNAAWRLRWRVERENLPGEVYGGSAQVAAACCVMALKERKERRETNGEPAAPASLAKDDVPLLDQKTAVTACLEVGVAQPKECSVRADLPPATEKLKEAERINEVAAASLRAKFDAAARAGLTAVLVCKSQLPKNESERKITADLNKHTTLIQPIETLDDAYFELTNKAMRDYAHKVVEEWPWVEKDTPPEYKDASKQRG